MEIMSEFKSVSKNSSLGEKEAALKDLEDKEIQVNLFQKHLFLRQLTHNMTKDCSLIYQFST